MCGLIAAQLKKPWLNEERLDTALKTIAHRGPDGRSHWFAQDRLAVLGHVRLSIIGLNNGTQPIGHTRGDVNLVVNGEFYGYKNIRDELREKGYRFATESDSEIALHLYDEMGFSFVDRLRGEFALVLADRRSGEMIAARDRFGIKPLFYTEYNGDVYFASEVKALFALGVPARWDSAAVLSDCAGLRSNASPFADIHQVPPGCLAIARNGRVRIVSYWDVKYPTAEALSKDSRPEQEVIAGFRKVLEDAVEERLTADVEVACYLSGGLDSSAVLGLAQAKLARPIRAFTIAFEEGMFNEAPLAQRTAAFTKSNYVPVPVTPRMMADSFSDAVWHGERPINNGNAIAKFLLSRAVRDAGIKVVFTGEGSDEMLAGYPSERRDLILHGREYSDDGARQTAIDALVAANPAFATLMSLDSNAASIKGIETIRERLGHCPTWISGVANGYLKTFGLMRSDAPCGGDIDQPYEQFLASLDIPGRLTARDAVNASLYAWQKTMLVNIMLTVLGDRMEMAHSIEGRVPFLDHHVAEYAANLPINYKIRGMKEKFILREAARDVLTEELYERQKHPFLAPPLRQDSQQNARDPMRELCEDVIRSKSFADQPFFDQGKTLAFLDEVAASDPQVAAQASAIQMRVASYSLMQQRFGMSI